MWKKFGKVLLANQKSSFEDKQPFFLLSLNNFVFMPLLTVFEWLLVIIFSLYITALKIIALTVFFSINVDPFISLLILLLVWCLDYNSVSITNLPIFKCSFFLPCFIETFILAKVSITLSRLYVFMNWIAASIFINRIFRSSRVRVTIQVSCPCFFLIYLNILQHGYSLIMNIITRSLNTTAGWNKYYFDLIGRLAYSTSHFQKFLFLNLQGKSLKAGINLFICYYGSY